MACLRNKLYNIKISHQILFRNKMYLLSKTIHIVITVEK